MIVNAKARRADDGAGAAIRQAFRDAGIEAEVRVCDGAELTAAARDAAAAGVDAVVAAGGDGTVSAVAQGLVGSRIPLGVLPLGTLNHFARDLGMPSDIGEAARAIAAGEIHPIDVGEVNGRCFVNNSSIGLYPEIVRRRDEDRRRTGRGKWRAMIAAGFHVLRRFPSLLLRVVTGERSMVSRTPLLFVGNNEYHVDPLRLGERQHLDRGVLALYMFRCRGRLEMFWLIIRAIFQRLDQVTNLEAELVREARVELWRRRVRVALDGEVATMQTPLRYRVLAGALMVLRPPSAEAR